MWSSSSHRNLEKINMIGTHVCMPEQFRHRRGSWAPACLHRKLLLCTLVQDNAPPPPLLLLVSDSVQTIVFGAHSFFMPFGVGGQVGAGVGIALPRPLLWARMTTRKKCLCASTNTAMSTTHVVLCRRGAMSTQPQPPARHGLEGQLEAPGIVQTGAKEAHLVRR